MNDDTDYVGEAEIDYDAVLARGGANCGDEDFALFGCPFCRHIYLIEYEVDTAYLDGKDLTKRVSVFNTGFTCVACSNRIEGDTVWIGPRAPEKVRVRRDDLMRSDWRWVLRK